MAEKMRLTCPNCSAQYEVDASAIPASGRDVQCSNCGHTWWQRPGAAPAAVEEPAEVPEPAAAAGPTDAPPAAPAEAAAAGPGMAEAPAPAPEPAAPAAPVEAAAEAAPAAADDDELWTDDDEEGTPPRIADPARDARRRTLDEAVLDVLREEAEREARARQSEGAETAAEAPAAALAATLGRGEGEREAAVRERMEAIDGIDETARVRANQRLPDVDEINSTLEGRVATTAPADDESAPVAIRARSRAGFRFGFVLTFMAAIGLLLVYVFADAIVAQAPSLEPGMTRFTERVDAGRIWLNGAAVSATEAIRGMTRTE
jgi:predicted Zn finger-like uncharacterized protein